MQKKLIDSEKEIEEDSELLGGEELKSIAETIEKNQIVVNAGGGDETDSYYKAVVNKLMDIDEDVSAKTEYLNVRENFAGAKLSFLSKFGKMPYLNQFVTQLERKRISLNRKGRKELIMALNERYIEEQRQQRQDMTNYFGLK